MTVVTSSISAVGGELAVVWILRSLIVHRFRISLRYSATSKWPLTAAML